MPLHDLKFDQHKIDSLKRYLQRESEKGRTKDYEIIIDGFRVVSRTDDITEFDDYEQEIKSDTRNISILIFDGPGTNRNTRYSFSLQSDSSNRSNGSLNGLGEIEQVIADKLAEREREHDLQQVKEQLKATKQQLAESEEYSETLEQRIKDMESKRFTNAVSIGEVASLVLNSLIKKNIDRIPGGQALAGLLGADEPDESTSSPNSSPAPVSFEKQSGGNGLDEQTQNRLALIEQMQQNFNEQQMIGVFSILDILVASPDKIDVLLMQLQPGATMQTAA
jgi:hypothetical protein